MKKKAAAIFLRNDKGHILGVSRKDNPNDFGLPGGKLEAGETHKEAAIRETFEETGLLCHGLTKVFEREDGEYQVQTFLAEFYTGEITTTEKGVVKWVTEEELLAGSFGEYNRALLKKVKELNV